MMRALVIGASRGIGADLAAQVAEAGHSVVASVRSGDAPSGACTIHCDVADDLSVTRAAATAPLSR